jgi:hypothetical protein
MLDGFDRRSDLATHEAPLPAARFGATPPGPPPGDELRRTLEQLQLSGRRLLAAVRSDRVDEEELRLARQIVHDLDLALRLAPTTTTFTLDADGRWFEVAGRRTDLSRRCSVRRILHALVSERRAGSTRALDVHELFAVGWPGERIPYESQVRRVYTAIWTLRRLGLDALLLTRDGGYLLDPKQSVAFDDA